MKKYAPPNLWRMKFEHNLLILAEDTKKKKIQKRNRNHLDMHFCDGTKKNKTHAYLT